MKYTKIILPLFALGILVSSSAYCKSSQPANAWSTYQYSLQSNELETTFISEENEGGKYFYKYHVKNISEFYIYDFYIHGEYRNFGEDYNHPQYDIYGVKNDIFDYGTLLIGPNQEADIEFCVDNKFLSLDKIDISAMGYRADESIEYANDVTLTSSVLSLKDPHAYLSFETKDDNYVYYAILKANVDNNDYYFVTSDKKDFRVDGNFVNRCNDDIEISLVKVIKIHKYPVEEQNEEEIKSANKFKSHIALIIFGPIIFGAFCIIAIPIIIGIVLIIRAAKKKRNISK